MNCSGYNYTRSRLEALRKAKWESTKSTVMAVSIPPMSIPPKRLLDENTRDLS